jgi:di/tricarboxylate transporter
LDELVQLYAIGERSWEARILPDSPLINISILESRIGEKYGITITTISRDANSILFPTYDCSLLAGDILHIIGREERIIQLKELGMELTPEMPAEGMAIKDLSYLEIILGPHSSLEGLTLRDINFRQHYGASVIALKRGTRIHRTDLGITPLHKGDSLLAIGQTQRISSLRSNSDFIIIEPGLADEKVDRKKAIQAMGLVAAAVAASIAGIPIYIAVLSAAVISLLLRVIPPDESYQSIEWQAIFLIAGMYAVSIATVQTGLAGQLGSLFISLAKPFGALGLAASAYLLTGLLTQIVGGQVAALISGPIAISAAVTMGVNPAAVAVATGIGCSASFLTPMAHPVNILMIAPANYRFHDFFRIGWLLTVLSFIVLMLGMHLFWGLHF